MYSKHCVSTIYIIQLTSAKFPLSHTCLSFHQRYTVLKDASYWYQEWRMFSGEKSLSRRLSIVVILINSRQMDKNLPSKTFCRKQAHAQYRANTRDLFPRLVQNPQLEHTKITDIGVNASLLRKVNVFCMLQVDKERYNVT